MVRRSYNKTEISRLHNEQLSIRIQNCSTIDKALNKMTDKPTIHTPDDVSHVNTIEQ